MHIPVSCAGDFFQFPPTNGMPLYTAITRLAMSAPTDPDLRLAAALFATFRRFRFSDQMRSTDPLLTALWRRMRDTSKKGPFDSAVIETLKGLVLTPAECRAGWWEVPLGVTSNMERWAHVQKSVHEFAVASGQPVFKWWYSTTDDDSSGAAQTAARHGDLLKTECPQLRGYFVRGMPVMIMGNLEVSKQLCNGTVGTFHSFVPPDGFVMPAAESADLAPGAVVELPGPPLSLHVRVCDKCDDGTTPRERIVALPLVLLAADIPGSRRNQKTKRKPQFRYRAHDCQPASALTWHKWQGQTRDRIVANLERRPKKARGMCEVTPEGVYVVSTRVRTLAGLRLWPLADPGRGLDYLCDLRWDPYLIMWDNNYDANGYWRPNGLKAARRRQTATAVRLLRKIADITVEVGKGGVSGVKTLQKIRKLLWLALLKPPTKRRPLVELLAEHWVKARTDPSLGPRLPVAMAFPVEMPQDAMDSGPAGGASKRRVLKPRKVRAGSPSEKGRRQQKTARLPSSGTARKGNKKKTKRRGGK